MRRPVASALLLVMLAAFLAPAALAAVTPPIRACCRTSGTHHCSAMVPSGSEGGAQFQGQACPYRKPVAVSGSAAAPRATQTVALAGAHSFLNQFNFEAFISRREPPHSQRGPPPDSSVN